MMIFSPKIDRYCDKHVECSVPHFNDLRINITSLHHAIATISERVAKAEGFCFYTLNLDHLVKLRNDPSFQLAYRHADFISADGWPIVWMLAQKRFTCERTTGSDLIEPICAFASAAQVPVYFIGPSPEQQAKALGVLKRSFANFRLAGAEAPMILDSLPDEFVGALADRLNLSGARLCFLCIGAPKQELLAAKLRQYCPKIGFLCVGAALDFISGDRIRAPKIVQRVKFEWFWRMCSEPRRLGPRYWKCLIVFVRMAVEMNFEKRHMFSNRNKDGG